MQPWGRVSLSLWSRYASLIVQRLNFHATRRSHSISFFLSLSPYLLPQPWHPLTKRNQERKYLAEQKDADRTRYETERADELRRDADAMFSRGMAGNNTSEAARLRMQAPVAFMYEEPQALVQQREREAREKEAAEMHGPKMPRTEAPTERDKLVEKFPFLANAPQEGKFTESMAIQLKPFGLETRYVARAERYW